MNQFHNHQLTHPWSISLPASLSSSLWLLELVRYRACLRPCVTNVTSNLTSLVTNVTSNVCNVAEKTSPNSRIISFFSRGHHRKSLGIEITMLEQAMVILLNILTRVLFRSCWLEVSPCFTLVQFGLVGEGKSLAIRVSFFESSSIALVSCSRSRGGAWGWGWWWWRPWPWCRPGPSRPSPSSSASPSTLMMLTQSSFSPWREPRFRSGGHQCHSCQVLVKINYICLVFCYSPHVELNWS